VSTAILHLADVHFGAAAAGLPAGVGATLHRERLAALEAALTTAVQRGAAAVLVAGDLLEGRLAVREHAAALAGAFARSRLPVIVVPGNHDPAAPGSYYRTYPWPDNVTVVADERWTPVRLPQLTVHALGWTGGAATTSPLASLRLLDDGRPQVLLLHADLDPPGGASAYRPVTRAALVGTGAQYAALGHVHTPLMVHDGARTLLGYPGSLTPLGFGEEGPHGALWVEVGGRAEPLTLARRRFRTLEIACEEEWDPSTLAAAAAAALPADAQGDLVRFRLVGATPAAGVDSAALAALAWHVEVDDRTEPALDLDALVAEHPTGLLARFVVAMRARIAAHQPAAMREVVATAELDPEPEPPAAPPAPAVLALRYGVQALTGRRLHPL
jgi:exonuclease SbcD